MDCSTPGFPIPHHLPEFAQVHVCWIGDAIQSSHTLLPYSPSAFNLSQRQGLFQWVGSSHQVDKVLELQHQTFQRVFRVDFFKIDWFDLLAFQGTLKSLFQHRSPKALIIQLLPSLLSSFHIIHDYWRDSAAAKSLQSCPTLYDPTDGRPPGPAVPGTLQARTLEWVAISFSNAGKWKVKVKLLSRVRPSATARTAAFQAPPSRRFSRQEYWSGVPL